MSAYDKLARCLFNFKCKALETEVLGSRHNSGERRPQMHGISVHRTDKNERKFVQVCRLPGVEVILAAVRCVKKQLQA